MFSTTGPSAAVRATVAERSAGLCERCGRARAQVIHHRRPRKTGGTRRLDTNTLPNLLHLCDPCHLWIESFRSRAEVAGWLVPDDGTPAAVPVRYRDQMVWLRPDGGVDPTDFDD